MQIQQKQSFVTLINFIKYSIVFTNQQLRQLIFVIVAVRSIFKKFDEIVQRLRLIVVKVLDLIDPPLCFIHLCILLLKVVQEFVCGRRLWLGRDDCLLDLVLRLLLRSDRLLDSQSFSSLQSPTPS